MTQFPVPLLRTYVKPARSKRVRVPLRGMRPALLDEAPLETPVVVGVERLLGVHRVEEGAPAAPEHAVVPLREPGEPVPGIRIERFDHVVRHGVSLTLVRAA